MYFMRCCGSIPAKLFAEEYNIKIGVILLVFEFQPCQLLAHETLEKLLNLFVSPFPYL